MLNARRRLLLAGAAWPLAGCGLVLRREDPAQGPASAPPAGERQWARTAWRYVENNTDHDTGLVGGVDRTPVFTVANLADALAAVLAADALRVIDAREFDLRLSRLLGFAATLPLSDGKLPNKAYHARSGRMVDFGGQEADTGWSALDIGRLLLWLRVVGQRHPRFAEHADAAVLRWNFCQVLDDCGALHGASRNGGRLDRYREGRLGGEQLAAAGYAAWGFAPRAAQGWAEADLTRVDGLALWHDRRDPRTTGAVSAVTTVPWMLMGLELGWQLPQGERARAQAQQLVRLQEQRWRHAGRLTARSEYQRLQAPWQVIDAVFANGYGWNTVDAAGGEHEALALVSTAAAFCMHALFPGAYPQQLLQALQWMYDPDRGWFEGRLEAGGAPHGVLTLATNARVLQALWFRRAGPAWRPQVPDGLFARRSADPFRPLQQCLPAERDGCTAARATG